MHVKAVCRTLMKLSPDLIIAKRYWRLDWIFCFLTFGRKSCSWTCWWNRPRRVNFINMFTSSFNERRSLKHRNSVELSVSFYALGICVSKSCSYNVGEIAHRVSVSTLKSPRGTPSERRTSPFIPSLHSTNALCYLCHHIHYLVLVLSICFKLIKYLACKLLIFKV